MAKKNKFYAVQAGVKPGVYSTWDECKKYVDGVAGAKYRSFTNEEDAWAFVEGIEENDEGIYDSRRDGIVAYVDGSYDEESGFYAYGVVILNGDRETHLSGADNKAELVLMRNVAGEIMGAVAAMRYALDNGIHEITIVHDYSGIADWPLRNWAAKKIGTQNYVSYYDTVSQTVKIKFKKAKGHSGNFYNDVADALAKLELGVPVKTVLKDHIEAVYEME